MNDKYSRHAVIQGPQHPSWGHSQKQNSLSMDSTHRSRSICIIVVCVKKDQTEAKILHERLQTW